MENLRKYVDYYAAQLSGPTFGDAWHALAEAGPAALPYVTDAFNTANTPAIKIALVQIVREYRSAQSVPFFANLLQSSDSEMWKSALDGLVTLGGKIAVSALVNAHKSATGDKRDWIDEVIEQILTSEDDAGTA